MFDLEERKIADGFFSVLKKETSLYDQLNISINNNFINVNYSNFNASLTHESNQYKCVVLLNGCKEKSITFVEKDIMDLTVRVRFELIKYLNHY